MSDMRKFTSHSNTYFITCKTLNKNRLLIEHVEDFKSVLSKVHIETQFNIIAWVLLPDHFHMVIEIKEDTASTLLHMITNSFNDKIDFPDNIWEENFWIQRINTQQDLNRYINYIHFNPVYHAVTKSPFNWTHSSIHKYYDEGLYPKDWASDADLTFIGDYGE